MINIPGTIPIRIHPFFWFLAAAIGWLNSQSLLLTLLWMVIITISVLVHEYGHGYSALAFGQRCRIELIGMGGVTYRQGSSLKWWQDFLIVLSGPLAGMALALLSYIVLQFPISNILVIQLLRISLWVNVVWSIFNLLPVFPLDGGQLLKIVFEAIWGVKGMRIAIAVGIVLSVICGLIAFVMSLFFMGAVFLILAFESFRSWKQASQLSDIDRDENLKQRFLHAQKLFEKGLTNDAWDAFKELRESTGEGLTYSLSTLYMSKILMDKGNYNEAYIYIKPIKKQLPGESMLMLHRLAFESHDYEEVCDLANECYRIRASSEVAYRNAVSFAHKKEKRTTIGWLQSAQRQGMELSDILKEDCFDFIRKDQQFLKIVKE